MHARPANVLGCEQYTSELPQYGQSLKLILRMTTPSNTFEAARSDDTANVVPASSDGSLRRVPWAVILRGPL
jgi:hypothetical protein